MKIIPWKCHICGRDFETSKGGLCKICNKATCLNCFGIKEAIKNRILIRSENLICLSCFKNIAKNRQDQKISAKITKEEVFEIRKKIREIERKAIAKLTKYKPPDDAS